MSLMCERSPLVWFGLDVFGFVFFVAGIDDVVCVVCYLFWWSSCILFCCCVLFSSVRWDTAKLSSIPAAMGVLKFFMCCWDIWFQFMICGVGCSSAICA